MGQSFYRRKNSMKRRNFIKLCFGGLAITPAINTHLPANTKDKTIEVVINDGPVFRIPISDFKTTLKYSDQIRGTKSNFVIYDEYSTYPNCCTEITGIGSVETFWNGNWFFNNIVCED